jgi:hypothetical protein
MTQTVASPPVNTVFHNQLDTLSSFVQSPMLNFGSPMQQEARYEACGGRAR